ncbi:transposase [uncultured Flavobacterium sp.]|uniref:transposase n=1 Tax=uncultured Flavobacterium sp. TaxID=165435 RepID=UPI002930AF9A|nr:transposase [uncultured Flavobacterium sp.]
MTLFKDKYKIDSKRLKNWDYSSQAVYFITLVTKNRECIFGSIEEDKMILNENGQIVEKELLKSIKIRKDWFFHNWIVMPNHIHLLIEIQDNQIPVETNNLHTHIVEAHSSASTSGISTNLETNIPNVPNIGETHCCAPLRDNWNANGNVNWNGNENQNQNKNLLDTPLSRKPNSISSFVAVFKSITTKQINGIDSIWQSNYHDHIVRNYKTFETIYNYIKTNPRSWETDSMKH